MQRPVIFHAGLSSPASLARRASQEVHILVFAAILLYTDTSLTVALKHRAVKVVDMMLNQGR